MIMDVLSWGTCVAAIGSSTHPTPWSCLCSYREEESSSKDPGRGGGTRAKAPCLNFPRDTGMQEKMQRKSTLKMDDLGNCEECHDKKGFCSVFGHLLVSGLCFPSFLHALRVAEREQKRMG